MTGKMFRWGIIGCGNVTEHKSGPALSKVSDSMIAAVMRRDGKKAANYAQRHNIKKWYTDASQLINDPDVNIVYVATPPSSHAAYTIEALKAGKPVYVEKPMGLNYRECSEMIETAKRMNLALFVAYYRRALPEFIAIKKLIDEKKIGDIRMVNITLHLNPREGDNGENKHWHVQPEISGGGHFADLAPHQFDLMEYFFGQIEAIRSFAVNQAGYYTAEDCVTASFTFSNGIIGNGSWCFTTHESCRKDETVILGSQGKIIFSTFDHTPVILVTKDKSESLSFNRPEHIQQPLIQSVIDELSGQGKSPCDTHSAARTTKLIEMTLKEYYTHIAGQLNE